MDNSVHYNELDIAYITQCLTMKCGVIQVKADGGEQLEMESSIVSL